jgi:CAAX protease family protein
VATESQPLDPQNLQPAVPQAPARAPRFARENPVFNGWEVFLMFVIMGALIFVVTAFGVAIPLLLHATSVRDIGAYTKELAHNVRYLVLLQSIAYAFTLLILDVYMRSRYRVPTLRAVGWTLPRPQFAAALAAFGIAMALFMGMMERMVPVPKDLPVDEMFRDPRSIYVVVIYAVLVAPFVEETFFRGLLYPVLNRRMGMIGAIVLTGAAFAAIHVTNFRLTWWPLFLLFLVGLALTAVRALTRSLAASVLVHMAYNSTLMVMLWLATDHFRHLERVQ